MTEKYCPLPKSICEFGTNKKADCENCELNKRYTKRTVDNWESYIVDNKTGEEYGNDINPLLDLLNEQEETIKRLKTRNKRQYERLKELTDLMFKRDWKTLETMVDEWEREDEYLRKYGG